ncbi:MAG: mercury methylation ferredoxin HgcB [Deltaproteobacteria bacterium]|jgi:ferredoxin|nr:4Fe-4S binding protein [Deltaproteobacteria bacterium]MCL5879229.1 4Fe-4S binding protein [Deltaproteobacteria bacterium]MDA8304988.1 mercury methylation ferredoxin HgcB [Deltaproteobacteria bacterium]
MKYLRNVSSLRFFPEKCANCAICIDVCPHEVFFLKNKKVEVKDKNLCMECGACALNCKYGAITVNSGMGCASGIINGMLTGGPPSCDCGSSSPVECC